MPLHIPQSFSTIPVEVILLATILYSATTSPSCLSYVLNMVYMTSIRLGKTTSLYFSFIIFYIAQGFRPAG